MFRGCILVRRQMPALGAESAGQDGRHGEVGVRWRLDALRNHVLTEAQLGEAGKAVGVHRAVRAHQRGGGELIEDHDDDRPGGTIDVDPTEIAGRLRREERRRSGWRTRTAPRNSSSRQPGTHEQLRRRGARNTNTTAPSRRRDGEAIATTSRSISSARNTARAITPESTATTVANATRPCPSAVDGRRQPDRGDGNGGRHQGDQQGEDHDLAVAVAAGDEELRIATKQVETGWATARPERPRITSACLPKASNREGDGTEKGWSKERRGPSRTPGATLLAGRGLDLARPLSARLVGPSSSQPYW